MLDAARAVVGDSGRPVALFGYSQGGGAAAAGAELAEAYAPELNLRATYTGAPPADLIAMLGGSPNLGPNLAYVIAGFSARDEGFATAVNGYLNSKGRYWLAENSRSCIIDSMLRWGATPLSSLSDTGMSMADFIASDKRVSSVLAHQKLGTVAFTGRVFVGSAPNDDIVNHDQAMHWPRTGRSSARRWRLPRLLARRSRPASPAATPQASSRSSIPPSTGWSRLCWRARLGLLACGDPRRVPEQGAVTHAEIQRYQDPRSSLPHHGAGYARERHHRHHRQQRR